MLTRALLTLAIVLGLASAAVGQDAAIVTLGLSDHKVTEDELYQQKAIPKPKFNSPGVAYGLVAHAMKGDRIEVHLTKDGQSLMKNVRELDSDENSVLLQAGKTGVPAGGWPIGQYTAQVKVLRGGETIAEQETDAISFE